MRTIIPVLVVSLTAVCTASAGGPVLVSSCDRSDLWLDEDRDACWSEPPDWQGSGGTSEVIEEYALVTEVANDFIFDFNERIVLARWWGVGMG